MPFLPHFGQKGKTLSFSFAPLCDILLIRMIKLWKSFCQEPFPFEVNPTLHPFFPTLRQANRTYCGIRDAARALYRQGSGALLAAVIFYKALTNLAFLPAMRGIWALTLRIAPLNYLNNNNANQIFMSPAILGGIVVIALLVAVWNLYEFSLLLHGFDTLRRGDKLRLLPLFGRSLADIRHAAKPKNWPVLLYSLLLIPFTNLFVTSSYITQLAVPAYFMSLIRAKPLYLALYGAVLAAVLLLCLFLALVLPLFTLERRNFVECVRLSAAYAKNKFLRLLAVLLRWNLEVLLGALVLYFGAAGALYGCAALIGLRSTRAMLLLSRVFMTVEYPFFGFLLDCRISIGQGNILALLHQRHSDQERVPLPAGKRRTGSRALLAVLAGGVTLFSFGAAFYLWTLPQDSTLLTAVGGVTPLVTFHRGDCSVAPENTIPAFRSAILKGGDRIELDVQMTKDGVAMVTHDANLKRCTGKNAKIYDLTYEEVEQLDAGSWFSSRFAGTKIPTLEEVLQLCQGRIGLNVEIKPDTSTPTLEAETIRLLRQYGFDGTNCVITSQSYETLHKVKQLAPDIPTGYILALGAGNYYDLPDVDFFSMENTFITAGMVNQLHLRGKTVSAWTIVRETDASHMLELGVDDLITDKPDMVQALLAQNRQTGDTLVDLRDLLNALFHPDQPDDTVPDSTEEVLDDAVDDPGQLTEGA